MFLFDKTKDITFNLSDPIRSQRVDDSLPA